MTRHNALLHSFGLGIVLYFGSYGFTVKKYSPLRRGITATNKTDTTAKICAGSEDFQPQESLKTLYFLVSILTLPAALARCES